MNLWKKQKLSTQKSHTIYTTTVKNKWKLPQFTIKRVNCIQGYSKIEKFKDCVRNLHARFVVPLNNSTCRKFVILSWNLLVQEFNFQLKYIVIYFPMTTPQHMNTAVTSFLLVHIFITGRNIFIFPLEFITHKMWRFTISKDICVEPEIS